MMKILISMFMLIFLLQKMNKNFLIVYIYNFLMIMLFFMLSLLNFSMNWMKIYWVFGLDEISMILVILSVWIISLMYLVSLKVKNKMGFSLILLILLLDLILSFFSMNYFLFYLFFEISLIPTFMLIMGWGYQPERINASMYMMLYTMFASLPMLLIIFILFDYFFSMSYMILLVNFIFLKNFYLVYIYMIFAFLVKLPIFLFHMWLPKAHVEAPVSGSMILAGVMLKLGGYGIFRSLMMMINLSLKLNLYFIILSMYGVLILSGVCLRQMDMKLLVAYSSVVHMGIMLSGVMSMFIWGMSGALIIMVGHGFCSPAMFVLVNYFYERTHSRSMILNKGLNYFFPSMMFWWFMMCIGNMAAPVTLNLLSEIMIFSVMLSWSMELFLILILGMFLSASYSLYLFSYSFHGKYNFSLVKIFPMYLIEFFVIFMHWFPLNLLILKLDLFY